jgi:transketolase
MRKLFFELLHKEMEKNNSITVCTGDMGYGLLDKIRKEFPDRFFDFGASEQLMVGAAAGMALERNIPVCYSITPFLLYRPFEFIRNFMDHEQIPIKLVGGGRDKDYGHLGFTHWAEDDVDIMMQLRNIKIWKPSSGPLFRHTILEFLYNKSPSYINLAK